ncbi:MAG: Lrp/AsnC family transcriptional regulator [Spirochaetales bacterium]|nr:Lrp/AsnC family transcriptional regulator [Spirochaetales bacterium]
MENLDKINRKILNILQDDCSITNNELAKRVGLAPATTLERVRKLESRGILSKYVAQINPKTVDKDTVAFVELSLSKHTTENVDSFNKTIATLEEVEDCYRISGDRDYLLKVRVKDIKDFDRFSFEQLSKLPGVERCSTKFVLKTIVSKTKITLSEDEE